MYSCLNWWTWYDWHCPSWVRTRIMGTRIYLCGYKVGMTFCLRPCPVLFGTVTCLPAKNCHRAQRRWFTCRLAPHGARVILQCSGKREVVRILPSQCGEKQVWWCQLWLIHIPWKQHCHCCLHRGGMSNRARELQRLQSNGDPPSLYSKLSASDSNAPLGIRLRCAVSTSVEMVCSDWLSSASHKHPAG